MVASWSNEETKVLTILGEQNIPKKLDGIMGEKVVYEKVLATKNRVIKVAKGSVMLKSFLYSAQSRLHNYSIAQCTLHLYNVKFFKADSLQFAYEKALSNLGQHIVYIVSGAKL